MLRKSALCYVTKVMFHVPELEQKVMSLTSAFEDLLHTTLSACPGLLAKFDYLSSLKQVDGGYGHWGLSRVYGELAAKRALAESHSILLSEILRSPLRTLMDDVALSAATQEQAVPVYLTQLEKRSSRLLPEQAGGGSDRHFSSVLHALSALARSRPNATRPNA